MNPTLKRLVISMCVFGVIQIPALADESSHSSKASASVEQRLDELQNEVIALRKQLKTGNALTARHYPHSSKASKTPVTKTQSDVSSTITDRAKTHKADPSEFLPVDVDVPGQAFVSSGPYIGVPIVYSGMDLIINNPNINEDVTLLNVRKDIRARLRALGRPIEEDHAHLLLSGVVEGQAMYKSPGVGPRSSDIDLSSAGLDAYVMGPSPWISGLLSFSYDNNLGTSSGSLNNQARSENSRLYVNKAFVVIGNFEKSPIYGSFGQMYVPFGTYSSSMISSPVTKVLGNTKARAVLVGYQHPGPQAFYAASYIFKGDSYVGATRRLNNGGVNMGYRFKTDLVSGDFGAGMIANIADSNGMQNNGNSFPTFAGFGGATGGGVEKLQHRVPAVNLRGVLSLGHSFDFLAEYVGATSSFNPADLTVNNHGAKPQAFNAEVAYTFSMLQKPSSLALGFGKTKDALPLGLPAQRYSLELNTSLWKDTLESLEFRHDIGYAASYTSTGSSLPSFSGTGRADNALTAQFDIYF